MFSIEQMETHLHTNSKQCPDKIRLKGRAEALGFLDLRSRIYVKTLGGAGAWHILGTLSPYIKPLGWTFYGCGQFS